MINKFIFKGTLLGLGRHKEEEAIIMYESAIQVLLILHTTYSNMGKIGIIFLRDNTN